MLFAGSRLFYFLQFGFPDSPVGWIQSGGLSLYEGLAGLLTAWVILFQWKPFPFPLFLDCVTPALALGLSLGRIGCFLAGCSGGRICGLPWAVRFPNGTPTLLHQQETHLIDFSKSLSLPVHPTQLYESLFGMIAFFLLLLLMRRKTADGQVFLTGMLWYSVFRFASETIRADAGGIHPFGTLTFALFISVLLGAGAVSGLIFQWRQAHGRAG